jgi:hypothetical protein
VEPVELPSGTVLGGDLWKGLEDPLAVHGISEPVGFHAEHGGVEFRWCHGGVVCAVEVYRILEGFNPLLRLPTMRERLKPLHASLQAILCISCQLLSCERNT